MRDLTAVTNLKFAFYPSAIFLTCHPSHRPRAVEFLAKFRVVPRNHRNLTLQKWWEYRAEDGGQTKVTHSIKKVESVLNDLYIAKRAVFDGPFGCKTICITFFASMLPMQDDRWTTVGFAAGKPQGHTQQRCGRRLVVWPLKRQHCAGSQRIQSMWHRSWLT